MKRLIQVSAAIFMMLQLVLLPGLTSPVFAESGKPSITLSPVINENEPSTAKFVYDVVIHDPKDMDILLGRIESLSLNTPPGKDNPGLALVLHGPEIAFFSRKNYRKYMSLVDRAKSLDKKGIIDVKVCDTMIRELNLEESDLPDFVDHVPYGPAEVERLVNKGFIRM